MDFQKHEVDIDPEINYGTPLHSAAATGSLEWVKYLLDQGADVNCKNDKNITALCYAIRTGTLEIVK